MTSLLEQVKQIVHVQDVCIHLQIILAHLQVIPTQSDLSNPMHLKTSLCLCLCCCDAKKI